MTLDRRLEFYDSNLNRLGTLLAWISLVWEEKYYTYGDCQIEVHQSDSILDLLKPGNMVCLTGHAEPMILHSVELQNKKLVANGYSASWLLSMRTSRDIVKNEVAEVALRRVVSGMTPWTNLELGELHNLPDKYTSQTSGQSVLAYCENVCKAVDMGFHIIKSGKKLLFECYKPERNLNLRYAEIYGNMGNIEYTLSNKGEYNVATVAGAGEGDARIVVTVGRTDLTGAQRKELYVDARDVQKDEGETDESYTERLRERGLEKLASALVADEITFDVASDGLQLGDYITANIDSIGVKMAARVSVIKQTVQNNKISTVISLGEPLILKR